MSLTGKLTDAITVSQEYANFMAAYYNMMGAAQQFIDAGNILAADQSFLNTASTAFKTWGSQNITTVSSFISSATTPPVPS